MTEAAPKLRAWRTRSQIKLPGGSRADDPDLTVGEFAAWLGYAASTLRRAIRRGELKAITLHGPAGKPSYRLELPDCIAFLKSRRYDAGRVAILERVARRRG